MKEDPIAVIITVKNGEKTIGKCLDSVLESDWKNIEIIVVDDASTDATAGILRKYGPKIRVITNEKNMGPALSRNIAVAESKSAYLAFTDSDCLVDRYWLNELVCSFNDPGIAGAGGCQIMPDDETGFGRIISAFLDSISFASEYLRRPRAESVKTDHNPSCNVMYKKQAFLDVGGFSKTLWTAEDVDLDYRLRKNGYSLVFNPRAVVYHYRPGSLKEFAEKMFRYGLAQGVMVRKYGFFRKVHYLFAVSAVLLVLFILSFYLSLKVGFVFFLILFSVIWLYFFVFVRKVSLAFYFLRILVSLIFFWDIGFSVGIIKPDLKKLEF